MILSRIAQITSVIPFLASSSTASWVDYFPNQGGRISRVRIKGQWYPREDSPDKNMLKKWAYRKSSSGYYWRDQDIKSAHSSAAEFTAAFLRMIEHKDVGYKYDGKPKQVYYKQIYTGRFGEHANLQVCIKQNVNKFFFNFGYGSVEPTESDEISKRLGWTVRGMFGCQLEPRVTMYFGSWAMGYVNGLNEKVGCCPSNKTKHRMYDLDDGWNKCPKELNMTVLLAILFGLSPQIQGYKVYSCLCCPSFLCGTSANCWKFADLFKEILEDPETHFGDSNMEGMEKFQREVLKAFYEYAAPAARHWDENRKVSIQRKLTTDADGTVIALASKPFETIDEDQDDEKEDENDKQTPPPVEKGEQLSNAEQSVQDKGTPTDRNSSKSEGKHHDPGDDFWLNDVTSV